MTIGPTPTIPTRRSAAPLAMGAALLVASGLFFAIGGVFARAEGGAEPSSDGTSLIVMGAIAAVVGGVMVLLGIWRAATNIDEIHEMLASGSERRVVPEPSRRVELSAAEEWDAEHDQP